MPHQANSDRKRQRVLFVCTSNQMRSPTAERLYGDRSDLEVRSAGISQGFGTPLSADLVDWADVVFVMEPMHERFVHDQFPEAARRTEIVTLDIPDRYPLMDPELIELLRKKLRPHLGEPDMRE